MLIRETENWPNVRIRNWGMRNKEKVIVFTDLANYKPLISSTSQWEERTLADGKQPNKPDRTKLSEIFNKCFGIQ